MFVPVVLLLHGHVWGSIRVHLLWVRTSPAVSCMSGSSNLNSFCDRGQVAVQLVSCGVLPPGLVQYSNTEARAPTSAGHTPFLPAWRAMQFVDGSWLSFDDCFILSYRSHSYRGAAVVPPIELTILSIKLVIIEFIIMVTQGMPCCHSNWVLLP